MKKCVNKKISLILSIFLLCGVASVFAKANEPNSKMNVISANASQIEKDNKDPKSAKKNC